MDSFIFCVFLVTPIFALRRVDQKPDIANFLKIFRRREPREGSIAHFLKYVADVPDINDIVPEKDKLKDAHANPIFKNKLQLMQAFLAKSRRQSPKYFSDEVEDRLNEGADVKRLIEAGRRYIAKKRGVPQREKDYYHNTGNEPELVPKVLKGIPPKGALVEKPPPKYPPRPRKPPFIPRGGIIKRKPRRDRRKLENTVLRMMPEIEPGQIPEAEPEHPGHTLIQPDQKTLKSSAKYPKHEDSALVYGNLDNLGIRYEKLPERILYTGFRKQNNFDLNDLVNIIKNKAKQNRNRKENKLKRRRPTKIPVNKVQRKRAKDIMEALLTAIGRRPRDSGGPYIKKVAIGTSDLNPGSLKYRPLLDYIRNQEGQNVEEENKANEELDWNEYRRRDSKLRSKYYSDEKDLDDCMKKSESSSSESRSAEKNPGNPYTVFKNKYRQNWLWNHGMTGDHMNINPYGPQFNSLGPSGAELFFNRKWWYFNQDDYKPFR